MSILETINELEFSHGIPIVGIIIFTVIIIAIIMFAIKRLGEVLSPLGSEENADTGATAARFEVVEDEVTGTTDSAEKEIVGSLNSLNIAKTAGVCVAKSLINNSFGSVKRSIFGGK